ncbi:hypothetical protein [Streptomyces sp. bgisy100]|uniref:hypothetical protein n=1 Tax=Streptomyces sp. bgisy100 TaxID=3413783 RepID=UPI003D736DA2
MINHPCWASEDRLRAEKAINELASALLAINVELVNIDIEKPCRCCHPYAPNVVINLGEIRIEEAQEFANTLAELVKLIGTQGQDNSGQPRSHGHQG